MFGVGVEMGSGFMRNILAFVRPICFGYTEEVYNYIFLQIQQTHHKQNRKFEYYSYLIIQIKHLYFWYGILCLSKLIKHQVDNLLF